MDRKRRLPGALLRLLGAIGLLLSARQAWAQTARAAPGPAAAPGLSGAAGSGRPYAGVAPGLASFLQGSLSPVLPPHSPPGLAPVSFLPLPELLEPAAAAAPAAPTPLRPRFRSSSGRLRSAIGAGAWNVVSRLGDEAALRELVEPGGRRKERGLGALFDRSDGAASGSRESPAGLDVPSAVWLALAREIAGMLGRPQELRPADWRKEAALALRNDPRLPLEEALADAYAKVHLLSREEGLRISDLLSGKPERVLGDFGIVDRLVPTDQGLFAGTQNGLFLLGENGRWQAQIEHGGRAFDVIEFEGALYVATAGGVYVHRRGGWRRESIPHLYQPRRLVVFKGKLRVFANYQGGLYSRTGRGWRRQARDFKGQVNQLAVINGRAYAATQYGLYARVGGAWTLEDTPVKNEVYQVMDFQGSLYAATVRGLFRRGRLGWRRVPGMAGAVNGLALHRGALYAAADAGVFHLEKGRLRSIPAVQSAHALAFRDGWLYVGWSEGILRLWFPPEDRLSADWREQVTKSLGAALNQERAGGEDRSFADRPFPAESDRTILEEEGRTLFSGLGR